MINMSSTKLLYPDLVYPLKLLLFICESDSNQINFKKYILNLTQCHNVQMFVIDDEK